MTPAVEAVANPAVGANRANSTAMLAFVMLAG
jgi:hypothetical protein